MWGVCVWGEYNNQYAPTPQPRPAGEKWGRGGGGGSVRGQIGRQGRLKLQDSPYHLSQHVPPHSEP